MQKDSTDREETWGKDGTQLSFRRAGVYKKSSLTATKISTSLKTYKNVKDKTGPGPEKQAIRGEGQPEPSETQRKGVGTST